MGRGMGGDGREVIGEGMFGGMVGVKGNGMECVGVSEVGRKVKVVREEEEVVVEGGGMGMCLG